MPTVQAMTTFVCGRGGVEAGKLEYVVHDQGADDEARDEHQSHQGARQNVQGQHTGPAG